MMFASTALGLPLPIINMISAIVYYFVNRSKGRFVRFHSLQSLYSQLPVTALNSVAVIWTIVNLVKDKPFTNIFWGFVIALAVLNVIYLIFSIIGAVRAHRGSFYYFLFFGRVSYIQAYRKRDESVKTTVNIPPRV